MGKSMKITWTAHLETIFVDPPHDKKERFGEILDLSATKHNGFVTITIETPRKPRTTGYKSQSHHLNGHIQQIAEYTGMPFDLIKTEVKCRAVEMGYPILLNSKGEVQMDIYGRVMGISEADSSTNECAILIEVTHMLAAELSLILQEGS